MVVFIFKMFLTIPVLKRIILCLSFLLFEKLVCNFNRILTKVSVSHPVKSSENQTFSDGF